MTEHHDQFSRASLRRDSRRWRKLRSKPMCRRQTVADRAIARRDRRRLGEIGHRAGRKRKMRTQQLWHWMYFRGAKSFAEMTSVSKDMRTQLEGILRSIVRSGGRTDLQ